MEVAMPSRRHSSAMLSSPRSPSSTMRILSSAEKCRRVARRMSRTSCSAGAFTGPDFSLILAPLKGYDEPEILPSSIHPICLIGADAGHQVAAREFIATWRRHGTKVDTVSLNRLGDV